MPSCCAPTSRRWLPFTGLGVGGRYVLMTPQLAGVTRAELGSHAGSLTEERQTILAAIDFLLTGF